ncbi:carboxymuconolactone decarboxylase family protein [Spartinivicinus poritis]|uniref:Carboxymuconolactone decarboxylase family protein n=1 Tax=Spartinivicinus poritis TaxID=2994640 RepID=A0ABT5UHJ6_9GAMM|nr:carboxymuconolactone decarboxylase family protein [Spartinivicinus sp. A2-2]MDE1465833.1 carboxymuconolactone decarboxylase family protein [Spartinivicinus sp. A2-2]
MAYLQPLSATHHSDLIDSFSVFERILGFVPNSMLTMQRCPAIVKGFTVLTEAVMSPHGSVDVGFKRLIAHFASKAAGCRYCEAHSLVAAKIHGMSEEKVAAVWNYKTNALYTEAERVALDFALAAGSVPNGVDETLMSKMKQYWSEQQIVEILAAVCLYGFLNRWNDSMATDLEDAPKALANNVLKKHGWTAGKHV